MSTDDEPVTSDEDLLHAALARGEKAESDRDVHKSRAQASARRANEAEQRAEAAQAQIIELERAVREHSEEIERLVVRAVEAEQRASTAEADATDYLDRATCAEEDRTRIEAQARSYKQQAEENETRAEAWEENHQILAEHYQRVTRQLRDAEDRALRAEQALRYRDRDARHATAELDAVSTSWDELREECERFKNRAELAENSAQQFGTSALQQRHRAHAAEARAASWWEAAKELFRQRRMCRTLANEGWNRLVDQRQRAEAAEKQRDQWRKLALQAEDDEQSAIAAANTAEQRAETAEANQCPAADELAHVREDRDHWEATARGWGEQLDRLQADYAELADSFCSELQTADRNERSHRAAITALDLAYQALNDELAGRASAFWDAAKHFCRRARQSSATVHEEGTQ